MWWSMLTSNRDRPYATGYLCDFTSHFRNFARGFATLTFTAAVTTDRFFNAATRINEPVY